VHAKAVFHALGRLLQVVGLVLAVPLGIALWDRHTLNPLLHAETLSFLGTILLALLGGTILQASCRRGRDQQGTREGFAIVALGWALLALLGSIPLTVHFLAARAGGGGPHLLAAFTDAYFEIMSGFTTTGATILTDVEALPRGLLFWRSLTHWLGGMGIITLALAIFPAMGVGGYQMFRGEVPGPTTDRLRPRLAETAKILWGVYALLSAAQAALLMLGGMDLFEALCHTFGTMATGGFSTRNGSIGDFHSLYIEIVVLVFMFLAGTNFLLHYRVLFKRDWRAVRDNREFRVYAGTLAVAVVLCTVVLYAGGLPGAAAMPPAPAAEAGAASGPPALETPDAELAHRAAERAKVSTLGGALRQAAFQVVSITTTTGYCTADFDLWPRAVGLTLVLLMFWGGCAGSTGGGMKMIRVLVAAKASWRELRRIVRPRLVAPVKVGEEALPERMVASVVGFVLLFAGLFALASIVMTLFIPDLVTAVSAVAATIGNVGPGLGGVGATGNYAWVPIPGKWVLILCMLLGRLEIFTVLVLFRPSFWRR